MGPFSISCTTCQAKLRVRDPSAIGQILTCPKCGSMVLIEAPSSPEQSAVNQSSERPAAPVPRPPARPAQPLGPAKKPDPFADTVEDPTHYGTVKEGTPTALDVGQDPEAISEVDFGEVDPSSEVDGSEPLPPADWLSSAGRQRRFWILAAICLVAGISLAIAGFVYVVGRVSSAGVAQQPTPDSNTPGPESRRDSATPNSEPVAVPSASSPSTDPASSTIPKSDVPPAQLPETNLPNADVATELPKPVETQPTPRAENPANAPAKEATKSAEPPPPAVPEKQPTDTPIDLVPKDDERSKADRMAPDGTLSDTLRRLGGLVEVPESEAPAKSDEPSEPATASPTETPAPPAHEVPKLARPAPRDVNLTARLADPISAIEFTEMPLQNFLQFMTAYSTIPVTLDPDALVWLNLTPNTPVTLKVANTTVAKLLESALSKMGLMAVSVDNQLLVTRKSAGDGALRKTQRKVQDLVGTDAAQAELLQSHLKALVAPNSWADQGGKGTLRLEGGSLLLEQSDPVLIEVSALLERLRIARGLPKQSKFDERIFQPISRTVRATAALDKPVTLNYSRPTSFPRIVRRIAEGTGVSILIDWHAVGTAGWNPDAEITFTASGKPLREALNTLLQPMELAYRVVDETTLQITTLASMPLEIEFYPVGDLANGEKEIESLLTRLHESLPAEWFGENDCKIVFDPPSRCLLVLLPQPRQQAIEKLLGEWKRSRHAPA